MIRKREPITGQDLVTRSQPRVQDRSALVERHSHRY